MAQQKAVEPAVDEVDDLIDELQPGAKLLKGQYTITRYINSGGFGITYLAKDSLDRDVVIKECFPSSVCRRSKIVVAARSRAHTAELRSIIQLFVREARSLAKIVHPNIVAVHQVFEDNGTAYMAIDFIDGLDLQQIIDGEGTPLTPDHIVRITEKLLAAVGFIHDHDMLHRDISPDNVLIDKAGEPILIDFGAAREHASKTTRAMSALRVVKDGYSPQEFYIAGSEQGPWSDLYALAATLYHVISGEAPVNGQARLAALAEDRTDPYLPLTGRFPGYPPGYLEALDMAMNTLPKQRLQSAKDWLAMFRARPTTLAAPEGVDAAVHNLVTSFRGEATPAPAASLEPPPLAKAASRVPDPAPAPAARGKSPVQLVAGVAVALVVVGGGFLLIGPKAPAPTETAAAVAAGSAAAPSEPAAVETKPVETAAAETEAALPEPATTAPDSAPAAAATTVEPPAEAAVEPQPEAVAAVPETPDPADTAAEAAAAAAPPEPEAVAAAAPEPAAELAAAPAGKPSPNQIAFAAWDAEIPFASDDRMLDGKRIAVVTRIAPGVDVQVAGDWLAPGVSIHAVNGTPIQSAGSLTLAVMNAMAVDPDGKARVIVEYSDASRQPKSGLLTVGAVRLVSLSNGVHTRSMVVDGAWKTVVSGVGDPAVTTLREGDLLFRDKTTTALLDGPQSLESIIANLVAAGVTATGFSIIRDNKVGEAQMQLTLDEGQ
ncbi:serine/threonine-protein kinase [Tabrizicola sp.]|uniref:serine/threonine-protein kinase n=1 Tax=Tabrizicola sp. TaxID=2005166 RepID=UPI002FDEAFA1